MSREFELLCEKEFNLARHEAYENIDQEIAGIRNAMASRGLLQSSAMAHAASEAILARFDRLLHGFEEAYVAKWRRTRRTLSESDYEWLKAKITEKIDPEVVEVRSRCNSILREPTLSFAVFWEKAEQKARERRNTLIEKIDIVRLRKSQEEPVEVTVVSDSPVQEAADFWGSLHPAVVAVARPRFNSGHLADSVEAALKEVNNRVKRIVLEAVGQEFDGAELMRKAFSAKQPVLRLGDLSTSTGRDMQLGYLEIFAGSMIGIRNPKAHDNITIDKRQAIHFLYLASLLMFKVDEAEAYGR